MPIRRKQESDATPEAAAAAKPKRTAKPSTSGAAHKHTTTKGGVRTLKPDNMEERRTMEPAPNEASQPSSSIELEPRVTHEEIARLAYFYWLADDQQGGSSVDHWVRAERDLLKK